MTSESVFVVSWDCQGLETVLPITDWEKQEVFDILSGKVVQKKNIPHIVGMLIMRARVNSHRFYEIYAITAVEGITKEDIEEMFKNAPQEAANTMRRIGEKIYSDRQDVSRNVIT